MTLGDTVQHGSLTYRFYFLPKKPVNIVQYARMYCTIKHFGNSKSQDIVVGEDKFPMLSYFNTLLNVCFCIWQSATHNLGGVNESQSASSLNEWCLLVNFGEQSKCKNGCSVSGKIILLLLLAGSRCLADQCTCETPPSCLTYPNRNPVESASCT